VRLATGSSVDTSNRWQFSPALQIELAELVPGENDGWLTAARNGVSQVFAASRIDQNSTSRREDLLLLIRWPAPREASEAEPEAEWPAKFRLRLVPIDDLIPKYANPLDIQIFVIDTTTDRLVQSATLDISPWWFSPADARTAQIERAFRHYAESLVTSR
ncbi:MAG: hypothetical protein O7E57_11125, partial [Gammaproteobacteria bacterium]|nr:hypothetical protein [Gammaproteobacteria bacterium]